MKIKTLDGGTVVSHTAFTPKNIAKVVRAIYGDDYKIAFTVGERIAIGVARRNGTGEPFSIVIEKV